MQSCGLQFQVPLATCHRRPSFPSRIFLNPGAGLVQWLPPPGVVGRCSGPRPTPSGSNFRPLDDSGDDESRLARFDPLADLAEPSLATVTSSVPWESRFSLSGLKSVASGLGIHDSGSSWKAQAEVPGSWVISPPSTSSSMTSSSAHWGALGGPPPAPMLLWCGASHPPASPAGIKDAFLVSAGGRRPPPSSLSL